MEDCDQGTVPVSTLQNIFDEARMRASAAHTSSDDPISAPPAATELGFESPAVNLGPSPSIPTTGQPHLRRRRVELPAAEVAEGSNTPRPEVGGDTMSDKDLQQAHEDPNFSNPDDDDDASYDRTTEHREYMKKLWKSSDQGTRAFQMVHGKAGSTAISGSIMVILSTILPISYFAPTFSTWKSTPIASLPLFVSQMKHLTPDIYSAITNVTKHTSEAANCALSSAITMMFGAFGGQIHEAFVYAILIYIWTSPDSCKADEINVLLLQYMNTPHDQLSDVIKSCKNAYATQAATTYMSTALTLQDISKSPGYRRLHYVTNLDLFCDHWRFLFQCTCELLMQGIQNETPQTALKLISKEHFQPQQPGESTQKFFARFTMAYSKCNDALHRLNCANLLPHPDACVQVIYATALKSNTSAVLKLLKDGKHKYEPRHLTFETVYKLYLEVAETNDKDFSDIEAAVKPKKQTKVPTPPPPAAADDEETRKPQTKKRKTCQ